MKLSKNTVKTLWIAFIILSTSLLASSLYLGTLYDRSNSVTGNAAAEVSACFNMYPYWLNPVECDDFFTGVESICDVSAVHPSGILEYNVLNITGNPNGSVMLFEDITPLGVMTVNASANQAGNYTLHIEAGDAGLCPVYNETTFNITILQNELAPIFDGPLPNSSWQEQTILIPYDLDDYFTDPEGFPLSYRAIGNSEIKIDIVGGEVTLTPANDFCGEEIVYFVATDVQNLTARSNDVVLEVTCPQDEDEQDEDQQDSGGGGGGSFNSATCVEDFYCYDWSECQFTEAISSTGDTKTLNITGVGGSTVYTLEEPLNNDEEVFYEGYQWRECIDTRFCTDRTLTYARSCEYEPSCSDGIRNQDETAIDCGGVCGPCSSCIDGIQNGLEEGVDCGGPSCEACNTCSDGVINGAELGVDCGGPDCPSCATCFDGIQNQGETDVDCGGPNCRACVETQSPAVFGSALTTVLAAAAAVLLTLVLLFLLARKYVIRIIAAYLQKHQKTNRLILLANDAKQKILDDIAELEAEWSSLEPIVAQQRVTDRIRDYMAAVLSIEREYSAADIENGVGEAGINDTLAKLLIAFSNRASSIEFSKDVVDQNVVHSILEELKQIIYQTSVLSVEELRTFEELPARSHSNKQDLDALFDSMSYGRYLLSAGRVILAENIYDEINDLYVQQSEEIQEHLYPEIHRYYLALNVEILKRESFLYGKMLKTRK